MGIDKADIRFIVHFHPSRSLDAYYQEVGRAGRDGKLSQGVLFYSNNDWANLRRWARADEYAVDFLKRIYAAIAAQLDVAINANPATVPTDTDSTEIDEEAALETPAPALSGRITAVDAGAASGAVELRRLQQVLSSDETTVRVAISLLERAGLLRRGFDLPREVAITVPRRLNRAALADHTLARLFKGLQLGPDQSATFALTDVARFMRWPLSDTEAHLLDLSGQGVFSLKFGRRAMFIELPAEPDDLEARVETLLAQSLAVAQRRIDDVIGYTTTDSCRHGYISAHFGSPPRTRCEVCDNCTGVRPDIVQPERVEHLLPDDADIEPMIIDCLISLPRPVGRSGLARILIGALRSPIKPDQARHFGALKALGEGGVIAYIDDLIAENRLRQYTRQDYLVLAPTLRGRTEAETWLSEHPELATYGEAAPETEASTAETETESDRYTALQKALWLWRRRLADELVQPVYVVMRNELMLRIAEARPQTLEALAALPGMGAQRMQHYGEALLDIVKLNPPQPGDDERLAVQCAELDAQQAARSAAVQEAEQVSPQLEKQIYMRLQEIRQKLAISNRARPFTIASDPLLKEIARRAPASLDALQAVPDFAASGLSKVSAQIITMIAALRQQA
jgi:ATP-dependent DNA helicase RecQ